MIRNVLKLKGKMGIFRKKGLPIYKNNNNLLLYIYIFFTYMTPT